VLDDGGHLVPMTPSVGPSDAVDRRLLEVAVLALTEGRLATRRDVRGVLIGLPMATRMGQLGALGLRSPEQPGLEMTTLLMAIANQVGLALRTARLSAEGRDMAVLEERTRLAREIHDTLAQQLTGIVIQLEAAQALVGRDSARAQPTLVAARDLARSALQEARRSVWDLRPTPLAATGMVAAIEMEVERFRERTGIAARMRAERMSPPPALDAQAEVTLLRIAQQALTNVADHSGASQVNVRVRHVGSEVELSVRDNGRGFEPGVEHAGSFGIVGMAERARLAGGSLDVDSAPRRGTVITVRLPVAAESMQVPA
jgi:signal transduction histidine kinase